MENITRHDFEQWANSPMTMMVRDYMLKQHQSMNRMTDSAMLEKTVHTQGLSPLEALGLESAMKLSVIKGIELFTDFNALEGELFEEGDNVES